MKGLNIDSRKKLELRMRIKKGKSIPCHAIPSIKTIESALAAADNYTHNGCNSVFSRTSDFGTAVEAYQKAIELAGSPSEDSYSKNLATIYKRVLRSAQKIQYKDADTTKKLIELAKVIEKKYK